MECKEGIVALQQLFPTSAKTNEDQVKTLTEKYHKYKKEYVQHLSFNPEEESIGMYIISLVTVLIYFQLLH